MAAELWVPLAGVFAIGIWWFGAPNSAIRFYGTFGLRFFERIGPGAVRAFGFWILACGVTGALAIIAGHFGFFELSYSSR